MGTIIKQLVRRVASRIPGTAENARAKISETKRDLERQLRADGLSRNAAKLEVAKRFRDG